MKTTRGGGSSSVFSRALKELGESMWASSMMYTLWRPRVGTYCTVSRRSRVFSTWVLEAASTSRQSRERPAAISAHGWQVPQGVGVGPWAQLRALARMRAVVVLPTPRGPAKRKAWATRSVAMAFLRVSVTFRWPTTWSKTCGRHRRAMTWYAIAPLEDWGVRAPEGPRDSDRVASRHGPLAAYRCFLPGLAGCPRVTRAG